MLSSVSLFVLIVIYSGVYGREVVTMQDFNSMEHCQQALVIVKLKMRSALDHIECIEK